MPLVLGVEQVQPKSHDMDAEVVTTSLINDSSPAQLFSQNYVPSAFATPRNSQHDLASISGQSVCESIYQSKYPTTPSLTQSRTASYTSTRGSVSIARNLNQRRNVLLSPESISSSQVLFRSPMSSASTPARQSSRSAHRPSFNSTPSSSTSHDNPMLAEVQANVTLTRTDTTSMEASFPEETSREIQESINNLDQSNIFPIREELIDDSSDEFDQIVRKQVLTADRTPSESMLSTGTYFTRPDISHVVQDQSIVDSSSTNLDRLTRDDVHTPPQSISNTPWLPVEASPMYNLPRQNRSGPLDSPSRNLLLMLNNITPTIVKSPPPKLDTKSSDVRKSIDLAQVPVFCSPTPTILEAPLIANTKHVVAQRLPLRRAIMKQSTQPKLMFNQSVSSTAHSTSPSPKKHLFQRSYSANPSSNGSTLGTPV